MITRRDPEPAPVVRLRQDADGDWVGRVNGIAVWVPDRELAAARRIVKRMGGRLEILRQTR